MFDFNEILAQMSAGKSPEDIANEFTASLNKAIKVQEEEAAKVNKVKEKLADAQAIADALNAFGAKHYPDQSTPVTAEQIVDTYEMVAGLDKQLEKLKNGLKISTSKKSTEVDVDKIFKNFFNAYGI